MQGGTTVTGWSCVNRSTARINEFTGIANTKIIGINQPSLTERLAMATSNPAQVIVDKFGGQSTLANLIGKGQSTVQYWTKTGAIPSKWQSKLLAIAAEQQIDLTAADFVKV